MSDLIVPGGPKKPATPDPEEDELPDHHPRDEDLLDGVTCPFVSTIQLFQQHPQTTMKETMTSDGKFGQVPHVTYFPAQGQALWSQCHRKCALFDHDNDCCSQSAKSRNAKPQEAAK